MKPRRSITAAALVLAAAFALVSVGAYAHDHPPAGKTLFFAKLTGANEVVGNHSNQGDPDGLGGATVQIDDDATTVCFGITVDNLDTPTAAHIHQGPAGVAGPIVVPFTAPNAGNPGTTSGCTTGVSQDLINAIKANPAGFYVNVHTTAFPGGAIRGQLTPAP